MTTHTTTPAPGTHNARSLVVPNYRYTYKPALDKYEIENPKAVSVKRISKHDAKLLISLGITMPIADIIALPRFPVLGTSSAKTEKGEVKGWITGICYLSPADESGFFNLCPWAGNCKKVCLNTAGRGAFTSVQIARQMKTFRMIRFGVETFLINAILDLYKLTQKAKAKGFGVACRLDGTSDLGLVNYPLQAFAGLSIAQVLGGVAFYEYTKSMQRMTEFLSGRMPGNVHFTFSLDGDSNRPYAEAVIRHGGNVAVCFDTVPETYMGAIVLDGDESDLRFLDPAQDSFNQGFIVGLKAKGKAKKIKNGFVQIA